MGNKKNKTLIFADLVLGCLVIILIFSMSYTLYRSKVLGAPVNAKLAVLMTAGLVFSIITLYMRDNWKTNIVITLFSTVIAAYGVEFVLFVQNNGRLSRKGIDARSKLEVINDLRANGIDAWPQVLSWLFIESNGLPSDKNRMFPLGGISQKTTVYCNESGEYKIFQSDEHGFNNPEGLYKKDAVKIVLVGDSFTMGSCVKSGEDIASRLRSIGIKALNLGNGGNGPLIELAGLKEYAEPLQPEIVLWIYYEGNDLHDLEGERKASTLIRYFEDKYGQKLLERQNEIDSALIKYVNSQWIKEMQRPQRRRLIRNEELIDQKQDQREERLKVLKLWYLRNRLGLINKPQKAERTVNFKAQLSLFSEILSTARKRSSAWGGELYFVYLPTIERYLDGNNKGSFFDRDDVLAIVHELGIPLIDFHEVLNKHADPSSLTPYLGAHYNAEGYKLVTELIISKLRQDKLIPDK